jgi:hypothetical protein
MPTVHGPDADAFIKGTKAKARKLGKDGSPRAVHDVNVSTPTTPNSGQIIDM